MATPLKLERYATSSKAEDAVVADLLFSLGLISAREQTVEIALELFDIAQQYGFPSVCDGAAPSYFDWMSLSDSTTGASYLGALGGLR